MDAISGCGEGGWTLVMKVDGKKSDFNYNSPYWTNKAAYEVEDGLEGLTEKQTKLASYWNTPFDKICLGMKVDGQTRWIVLNYAASSLYNVIGDGSFKSTSVGKQAWKSLIHGYRFNSVVIRYVAALTGPECAFECWKQDGCRSVNFRKTPSWDRKNNCELLRDDSETMEKNFTKDDHFDYYLLLNKPPDQTTQKPSIDEKPLSSCKDLLNRNSALPNGVYKLQNNVSLEQYDVYCHMDAISGCGGGGWTLVMKIDGKKNDFNYGSLHWTNKVAYEVEDGLEGLTQKQTKLASYWNTPFNKICLGMRVSSETKWITLDYAASSLYNVIGDGSFKSTSVGRGAWESLIDGSALQPNCNQEGINADKYYASLHFVRVRIGIVGNNQNHCDSCDSCIGFGTSARCGDDIRSTTCGNMAVCDRMENKNTPAFGFILVH
ncbi:uncharacterized protein LOC114520172 [Dendronephthya gigantea]|uniref:uncharacterized protein LOC114520172 n=1 Tax=Dendronephthya gigantea TaxID=151771 RepID=UPI00106949E3|nr:uncharacterized protein LOC114520172 [Dendronephthya gigantea]